MVDLGASEADAPGFLAAGVPREPLGTVALGEAPRQASVPMVRR